MSGGATEVATRNRAATVNEGLGERRAALWGVALFVIGLALFLVAVPLDLLFLVVPVLLLFLTGWGTAYAAVARQAASALSLKTLLPVVLLTFALFYFLSEHFIHNASGLGLGLSHETHILVLGFPLLLITMATTAFLALRG